MAVEHGDATSVDATTEQAVRRLIQALLRSGLALAFVLMAVGLTVKLFEAGDAAPAVRLFALHQDAEAGDTLMALGILVLALTPAIRVLALIVLWSRERDWRYVAVAVAVLVVLLVAVAVGHG